MKFHLIGIGGSGMSVLAELLLADGHIVSGSDREHTKLTDTLAAAGAEIFTGHSSANVADDAIVVVSSAIKDSNPELAIARAREQQIMHRSQALAYTARDKDFVAVAGTHGKTSTSSMLALALEALGKDPSRAIGGELVGELPGGYLGTGKVFVAEADESDESFLNYEPRVAVVTNVEADHLDHYGTQEAVAQAFVSFSHRLLPQGVLICCSDDAGARSLAQQALCEGVRVLTYGRQAAPEKMNTYGSLYSGHVLVQDKEGAEDGFFNAAELIYNGKKYELQLRVPGSHMLLNAAAAWAAGVELGEDGAAMAQALAEFRGAKRRFELLGVAGGVMVIDDYAHHPTEVAVTIRTARDVAQGRVHVLFQPLTYARTKIFAQDFACELSSADSVVVTHVYSSRDMLADGAQGDVIADLLPCAIFEPDECAALQELMKGLHAGDIAIMLGPKVRTLGVQLLDLLANAALPSGEK